MSTVERIARGFGIKAMGDPMPAPGVPAGLSTGLNRNGGLIRLVGSMGQARSATYRSIYLMNPFVYAATNYTARGIGRLPLHVYSLDADAKKTRIRGDIPQTPGRPSGGVTLDRMLSTPADGLSRAAFYGGTIRQRMIYGNALWEILDQGVAPVGLKRISWTNVEEVKEDGYANVRWYEVSERGKPGTRRKLFPEQVVHFGLGSETDQACGVSLLESCHATLALHEALLRHLLAYFENSARGSGHFKVDNEQQAKKARDMITQLYTSPENAGKILITSGEWKSMADSPEHSQIVELIKESRVEISAAFQTPPPILGLLENAIRANVKEMREQFGRDTLGPWATETEDEIEAQLISRQPGWGNLFTEFQLAEQLRPDLEARAMVYQRLMHIFSIDEIRAFENQTPFEIQGVTDIPWVASGAMPLTTAAQGKSGKVPAATDERIGALAAVVADVDARQHDEMEDMRAVLAEWEAPQPPAPEVHFHEGAFRVEPPEPAIVNVSLTPEITATLEVPKRTVVMRRDNGDETTYEET